MFLSRSYLNRWLQGASRGSWGGQCHFSLSYGGSVLAGSHGSVALGVVDRVVLAGTVDDHLAHASFERVLRLEPEEFSR
jgi:hypothetical protein